MYPSPKRGHQIARNDDDYQHRGGQGLGLDGMANIFEPLINAVTANKPKVLNKVGLDQKVSGKEQGFSHPLPQTERHRRTGGAYPILGSIAERGKPILLPYGKANRKGS